MCVPYILNVDQLMTNKILFHCETCDTDPVIRIHVSRVTPDAARGIVFFYVGYMKMYFKITEIEIRTGKASYGD